ncbi:MAG: hypothetical protein E7564_10955 [Ruminococcaceae bacterium]|nr:hypothetical protein [Oscillospiraceae bacterium]
MATNWSVLTKDFALRHTAFRAAFMSAYLTHHQEHRTDICIFYDVQSHLGRKFGGAFNFDVFETDCVALTEAKPERPYYVLKDWNELYKAGKQIYSETNSPDLYAVVAEGEEEIVVLVTSFNGFKYNEAPPKDEKFLLDIKDFNISSAKVYVVNEDKMYEEEILENGEFVLKGNSFVLIKIKK